MNFDFNGDELFTKLKGKTIEHISGLSKGENLVTFRMSDGSEYQMYHEQDCCESVSIEDVVGDVEDLIGHPLLLAEVAINPDEAPVESQDNFWDESSTWTYYKLATIKGSVDIRWYGTSNGYYSESVTFAQTNKGTI